MPAFFIVGSARSGTTLLRVMMNAHPNVAVPPESRFVVELHDGDEVEVDDLLARLARHRLWAAWGLDVDDVRAELRGRTRAPYPDAIDAVYRAYGRQRDKRVVGDKTPRYVEHIPLLARLFPEARFVHQVRDGRDVALSYADVPFGPKRVAPAAALWARRVSTGMRDGRALGKDRYLELRYEGLVSDPETHLQTVCGFVGVDYDPGMLDYAERARDDVLARARLYNPKVLSGPQTNARSWENDMPRSQVAAFEAIAGDVLSSLGYRRMFPAPSASARLRAALGMVGLPVGRLREGRPHGASRSHYER